MDEWRFTLTSLIDLGWERVVSNENVSSRIIPDPRTSRIRGPVPKSTTDMSLL